MRRIHPPPITIISTSKWYGVCVFCDYYQDSDLDIVNMYYFIYLKIKDLEFIADKTIHTLILNFNGLRF